MLPKFWLERIFEVEFLAGQALLDLRELPVGEGILHRHGDLFRHLHEQVDVILGPRLIGGARHFQSAQGTVGR